MYKSHNQYLLELRNQFFVRTFFSMPFYLLTNQNQYVQQGKPTTRCANFACSVFMCMWLHFSSSTLCNLQLKSLVAKWLSRCELIFIAHSHNDAWLGMVFFGMHRRRRFSSFGEKAVCQFEGLVRVRLSPRANSSSLTKNSCRNMYAIRLANNCNI